MRRKNHFRKIKTFRNELVGNYRYNELSGNLTDYSGKGNNGLVYGATYDQPGKIDRSYKFDGVNDYINLGDATSFHFGIENFTVAFWANVANLKTSRTDEQNTFISKDYRGFELSLYQGKLLCYFGGASTPNNLIGSTLWTINQWYLVLMERTDNHISIELNNQLEVQKTRLNSDVSRAGTPLTLGWRPFGNNFQYLNGYMDSTEIYLGTLNRAEKDALWNGGLGREL